MPELTLSILIISYNTREMTLACIRSVFEQTAKTAFEIIVLDNTSTDGSADAIESKFGDRVRLIRSAQNLGFAGGNNEAARFARGDYLLLLNPDTLVLNHAIDRLISFANANRQSGIWGGRTWFGDGSPNPTSCWRKPSPWSMFCSVSGMAGVFKTSPIFNPESVGVLRDDIELPVDIVSGCLLLIDRRLWDKLSGFDPDFFMYGEDADLCLRAKSLGARPRVTAEATIVHFGGQSERVLADKLVRLYRARRQLYARYWPSYWQWWADLGPVLNLRRRYTVACIRRLMSRGKQGQSPAEFSRVLARRREWIGHTE